MAYNCAFTIASLSVPGTIVLTDTSTGSDPNITGRSIELRLSDGSLLGGAAIDFPLSEGAIKNISIGADYALNIVLIVTSSSPLPPPSTYTASGLYVFTGFSYQFYDSLIGSLAYKFTTVADTNFTESAFNVIALIKGAERAGETNQQLAAQNALDGIAYYMTNQQTLL